ncbi:unnamed protein product [Strongylus vulgaris]|uniref:BRCT domain-containing protein n=1 Tax=Strongylus vulgaris TaxID=40348 RepID=A0A3P7IW06_STRVU|nr:unnamed protein product [Strongylus vulgaris]
MIFVFADFDSDVFRNFVDIRPEASVIGTALIRSRIQRNLYLPRVKPKRALYCDMLRNINVVIGYGEEDERILWGKLVRYMGGHVKKEPDGDSTFLVTKHARGRAFRMLVSLGQKVLLPSWLMDCWSNRDNLTFNPTENTLLLKHRIGVFESLKICIVGFEDDYADDIRSNISNFRGTIVEDPALATHVVVNGAYDVSELSLAHSQRIVTAEWVWTSISIQYCANEDAYTPAMKNFHLFTPGAAASRCCVLSTATNRLCKLKGTLKLFLVLLLVTF